MTKTIRLSDEAYQKILDESKRREMPIGEMASLRVIRNEFLGEEKSREKEARGEEEEEEEELTEEAKRKIEEHLLSLRREERKEKNINTERKEVKKKEDKEEEWECGKCGYEGTGNAPPYCPGCGVEFNL